MQNPVENHLNQNRTHEETSKIKLQSSRVVFALPNLLTFQEGIENKLAFCLIQMNRFLSK